MCNSFVDRQHVNTILFLKMIDFFLIIRINNYKNDLYPSPYIKYRSLIFLEERERESLIYFNTEEKYIYILSFGKRWKNDWEVESDISAFGIKDGLTWQFITSPVALYTGCRLNSLMAAEVEARFRPGPNDRVNFDRS